MRAASILCLVSLAGCEGCGGDEHHVQAATPATEPASGSTGGEGTAEGAGEPGPPPEVAVRTEVDRYGRLTLAVENHGADAARLAPRVVVEERAGDGFRAVETASLPLSVDCDAAPPECVTLAPGAVLYPCDCGGCDAVRGTHRFAVRSCGGAHRVEGDAVDVGLR